MLAAPGCNRLDLLWNSDWIGTVLVFLPSAMVANLLTALGEQIGWLPGAHLLSRPGVRLGRQRHRDQPGPLWHIPLILVGGYGAGTPVWYGIACFMISVTGMAVMMAWLRLRSGSM
jgi:uncharacterized protein